MKKSRKKIVFIGICLIVILFLIGFFLSKKNTDNRCKEILEYYGCTYIKNSFSQEHNFEKDIYAYIPFEAVDEYGISNQYIYEQIIKSLTKGMNQKNFRLIDEKQNIVIRVIVNNKNAKYTINGDNNYYQTQKAKKSLTSNEEEKTINLNIKSKELQEIIDNGWKRTAVKAKLGTVDSKEDDYDCYDDEGYKIKAVNLEIFNIVFTPSYKNEVFEGIHTGIDNTKIVEMLGKPMYEERDANILYGYKTDEYYVFFHNGEISIYKVQEFDNEKNKEFANILSKLKETNDYKQFIDKLTDIYSDFDQYVQTEDKIELTYYLRGFKVTFQKTGSSGITIYSNFNGNITNEVTLNDIKNGQTLPSNVFYDNRNGVFIEEEIRESTQYTKEMIVQKE